MVLAGTYDPESPIYITPENRQKVIYIRNVKFETRLEDYTHTQIYQTLDTDNALPLETPVWWVGDEPTDVPPTIELLTPTNNKMVIYPTSVDLTVNVTEGSNSIVDVEYFANDVSIGTSSVAPYSYTWVYPSAGVKDIYAIVTDSESLTDTSNEVSITVYNFIDGDGDFYMFLNEGTVTSETYGGETFIGALNLYEGPSLIDNVSPDTTEPIFLTGRAYYNLNYLIPVPNGSYTVKTYHNEPWHGVNDGGSPAAGWR